MAAINSIINYAKLPWEAKHDPKNKKMQTLFMLRVDTNNSILWRFTSGNYHFIITGINASVYCINLHRQSGKIWQIYWLNTRDTAQGLETHKNLLSYYKECPYWQLHL